MTSSMTGSRGPTGMSTGQSSTGKNFREKIPSGYKSATLQQFTPEQLELLQHMMSFAGPESFLSRLAGGDQSLFEEMEEPALRQFSQMQGGLASRFSGMGGGGGQLGLSSQKSSGFRNFMGQQAADFAKDLQGQRLGLQRQATSDLAQMANMLMGQRPFERALVEKPQESNMWGDILGRFAGAIPGAAVGFLTGGPAGAAVGGASGFMSSGGAGGGGSTRPTRTSFGSGTSGPFGLPTFLGM